MDSRLQSDAEALKTALRRSQIGLRVAIPGRVQSFDPNTQQVTVVPTIRKYVTIDGVQTTVEIPPIIKVPLVFPYAQTLGFALTLPISPGDMVLLVVADRSIDNWTEFSGIQNPVETVEPRAHDLTDSLAIVGAVPEPLALPNYQTNALELRNQDRSMRVTMTDNAIEIAAGSTVLTINRDGNIVTNADIISGGVSQQTHTHPGDSGGTTGGPN